MTPTLKAFRIRNRSRKVPIWAPRQGPKPRFFIGGSNKFAVCTVCPSKLPPSALAVHFQVHRALKTAPKTCIRTGANATDAILRTSYRTSSTKNGFRKLSGCLKRANRSSFRALFQQNLMSYALDEGDRCPLKTHARGVYFFLPNHCRDELLLGNQRKRQAVICRRCSFKNIGFQQHLFSIPNHVQHDAMTLSLENFSRSLYPHVSNAILEVPILEHQHYSSDSNYVHRATDISFLRFLPGRTSDDVQRHAKFHRVCCPVQPIPNY